MDNNRTSARRYGELARWADLKITNREDAMTTLSSSSDRFYVYVLCEPDGTPFYVGKGQGKRVLQHEADSWNTAVMTHKLNVIRRIRRDGGTVGYVIDGFFGDEVAVHARERALIAYYGRHDLQQGPLTNQIDGGEGANNPSPAALARHAASLGGDAADPARRVANRFLAGIAGQQDSVPIKPWSVLRLRAHLLRPSPNKPVPRPTVRMAKAIAASAISNCAMLHTGAIIPRRLVIEGVECIIENGCGGDMIHASMVEPVEPRAKPLDETLRLTAKGFAAVVAFIGQDKLVDYGILEP
ncbi:GIY-YIG nuclease family protein [Humitalea sp. 24SJ18S-53]|uniref:GIY-YIG nuclease family protein n=1 Tax=Humitalea sp. 24SJ18S-53 TaxID=3422307 RepID=UPI003D679594